MKDLILELKDLALLAERLKNDIGIDIRNRLLDKADEIETKINQGIIFESELVWE